MITNLREMMISIRNGCGRGDAKVKKRGRNQAVCLDISSAISAWIQDVSSEEEKQEYLKLQRGILVYVDFSVLSTQERISL